MKTEPPQAAQNVLHRAGPLTMFGVDALVAGAARMRPELLAMCDHGFCESRPLIYAALEKATGAFLTRLQSFGLTPGERVVLCAAPGSQAVVALTAIIAAGLEPVLAPPAPTAAALLRAARDLSVAAILAPARIGELDREEVLLGVAAQAPTVRLLGTLGAQTIDGAVDFSAEALASSPAPGTPLREDWAGAEPVGVHAFDSAGTTSRMEQGALLAHGLDLVRRTRQGGAAPIISLVSPGSFGGLVAGPLAALFAGAPLHFLAPFGANAFLALLDRLGSARLVAPAAIFPDLATAGLLTSGALISCTALSRVDSPGLTLKPQEGACPIIEIFCDGDSIRMSGAARGDVRRVA